MMRRGVPVLAVVVVVFGCDPKSGQQTGFSTEGAAQTGGPVVGRVGGVPIYASAVQELMAKEDVSAQTAFEALRDEELLVQHAVDTGVLESGELAQLTERMLVQALLGDMEADIAPGTISDEAVKEDFETHKDKFGSPERRKTAHVLARDQGSEAEAFANDVLSELRKADDPMQVFERYKASPPEGAFTVVAEDLPAISRQAGFAEEFKDAVFAAKRPGPLSAPVKTQYGWHAILLEEIQPAEVKTFSDMEVSIRERLTKKRRFETLAEIVRVAEEELIVVRDEEVIDRAMRTDLGGEEEP